MAKTIENAVYCFYETIICKQQQFDAFTVTITHRFLTNQNTHVTKMFYNFVSDDFDIKFIEELVIILCF